VGYTETPPPLEKRPLEERIMETRRALARLQARIRDQCPGDHKYVQHRDGELPWCDACGYTDAGLHRSEHGPGYGGRRRSTYDDDLDDDEDVDEAYTRAGAGQQL
jgi:hypothetical protein